MAEVAMASEEGAVEASAKELIDSMSDEEKSGLKGWYWYDWANQAYALTVMTVIVRALMANLYIFCQFQIFRLDFAALRALPRQILFYA